MSLIRTSLHLLRALNNAHPQVTVHHCRNISRWVRPTLIELKKRKDQQEELPPINRSTFLEWNYNSEIFSFSKRLHEEFNPVLLREAFTQRSFIIQEEQKQKSVGIENPITNLRDNSELTRDGTDLLTAYVTMFISWHLPKLPVIGLNSVCNYLLSDTTLAHASSHLGTKDLILSSEYPPNEHTLAITLKAIIGALYKSSGSERTFLFVRDFICTQLNQKEIDSMWSIDEPQQLLKEFCKTNKLGEPEPRLIGESAKNTVFATYHIGIYINRKLLGTGFGENVNTALDVAAINCLKRLYDIDNIRPYNFKITLKELEDAVSEKKAIQKL